MENNSQLIKDVLYNLAEKKSQDECSVSDMEAKLTQILQDTSLGGNDEDRKDFVEFIYAYISSGAVKRTKLLSYCWNFIDPTVPSKKFIANGEEIQPHKFLQEDELTKLYKFVKCHSADKTFGETVYKVMGVHGMTPPEVYKNVWLRRQDFSRATDLRTKSITRQLAWQIILGLHCSLDEADEVLFSAGFIRCNNRLDLIMEYFIRRENYDIMAINEVLDELGIKPFSCYKSVKEKDNK